MAKKYEDWGDAAANTSWSQRIPPAPGDLRIVQAFVNTRDREAAIDELSNPQALGNWLTRWSLATPDLELSEADLKRVTDVRQSLWSLTRMNWGTQVDSKLVERLDHLAADVPLRLRFAGAGAARLEAGETGLDGALGRIFKIVYLAQADGTWNKFRTCSSAECSRVFYDFSTNRSGRWCIKSICGDRINSRRYRRRR